MACRTEKELLEIVNSKEKFYREIGDRLVADLFSGFLMNEFEDSVEEHREDFLKNPDAYLQHPVFKSTLIAALKMGGVDDNDIIDFHSWYEKAFTAKGVDGYFKGEYDLDETVKFNILDGIDILDAIIEAHLAEEG